MNKNPLLIAACVLLPLTVGADLMVRAPTAYGSNTQSWGNPQDGATPASSVHQSGKTTGANNQQGAGPAAGSNGGNGGTGATDADGNTTDSNRGSGSSNQTQATGPAPQTEADTEAIRKELARTLDAVKPLEPSGKGDTTGSNNGPAGSSQGTNNGSGATGSNQYGERSSNKKNQAGGTPTGGGKSNTQSGGSNSQQAGGGSNSGSGGSKGGSNSNDNIKGYDYLTKQDEAMAPQSPPGAPALPSKCMEEENCRQCFEEARAGMDKTRLSLEKVRGIYSYTHKFTNAGIAFMQGISNQAGGVAALGAQVETVKVNDALDEFDQIVANKNLELLEKLKSNLQEVAACEAEHYKNDDWFNRYGFTYYQFMQANYSYVQRAGP